MKDIQEMMQEIEERTDQALMQLEERKHKVGAIYLNALITGEIETGINEMKATMNKRIINPYDMDNS